jgi:hypothetical protein
MNISGLLEFWKIEFQLSTIHFPRNYGGGCKLWVLAVTRLKNEGGTKDMENLSIDQVIMQAYKNYHSKLASMEESLKRMRLWTHETAKHVDKCAIHTHLTSEYVTDLVKEKGDELSSLVGSVSY